MLKEFKEFAFKGNVIDLAVGVIIGGAFGKIVTSLVNDLIMPIIGIILGGINFSDLKLVIRPASNGMEEAAIKYGAVCIFLFVKLANTLTRKKEEEKKPEKPSADVVLLTEIRDLLKKKN